MNSFPQMKTSIVLVLQTRGKSLHGMWNFGHLGLVLLKQIHRLSVIDGQIIYQNLLIQFQIAPPQK